MATPPGASMMSRSGLVVVAGATGRQGGAVARHLLRNGWQVRGLSRKPAGAGGRALAQLGAEVVHADMASPPTLRSAFSGAYGLFSVQNPMTSGLEAEVVQGRNVMDAAKTAGVEHIVYGSAGVGTVTGVGSWDTKVTIAAYARSLGLPLTVLRPTAFMELMRDKAFFPPVTAWHLMPKLIGVDRPLPWLCVDDLGAITARAFADPDRFIGAELALAAEHRTLADCRSAWREITGRFPSRFPMPVWMFDRFVGPDLIGMWRWLHSNVVEVDPATTLEILPTASTVPDWMVRMLR